MDKETAILNCLFRVFEDILDAENDTEDTTEENETENLESWLVEIRKGLENEDFTKKIS